MNGYRTTHLDRTSDLASATRRSGLRVRLEGVHWLVEGEYRALETPTGRLVWSDRNPRERLHLERF